VPGFVGKRRIYSVRTPEATTYADELARLASEDGGPAVMFAYTKATQPGPLSRPKRSNAELIGSAALMPEQKPVACICGPTA
jgi:ferredoxin-NADP reductase